MTKIVEGNTGEKAVRITSHAMGGLSERGLNADTIMIGYSPILVWSRDEGSGRDPRRVSINGLGVWREVA